MGANSLMSLFGIKHSKGNAVVQYPLLIDQGKGSTAQTLFSKLLGKILGFSASDSKEILVSGKTRAYSNALAAALEDVPIQDVGIPPKEFLTKLAMGSFHPVALADSKKSAEGQGPFAKAISQITENGSILLPGGQKFSARTLLKSLLRHPESVHKIVLSKNGKKENKKGLVFLAIPVQVSQKEPVSWNKEKAVLYANDPSKSSQKMQRDAEGKVVASFGIRKMPAGKTDQIQSSDDSQKVVLLASSRTEETVIWVQGKEEKPVPEKSPVVGKIQASEQNADSRAAVPSFGTIRKENVRGQEKKPAGERIANSSKSGGARGMMAGVSLEEEKSQKRVEGKKIAATPPKSTPDGKAQQSQKETQFWVLVPVSKESESNVNEAALSQKASTHSKRETSILNRQKNSKAQGKSLQKEIDLNKMPSQHSRRLDRAERISQNDLKNNLQSISETNGNRKNIKAILLSIEDSVKISGEKYLEANASDRSQKPVHIKIRQVEIRGSENGPFLAKQFPFLVEKAKIVRLTAEEAAAKMSTKSEKATGKAPSQKGTGGYLVQGESQKAGSGKKLINGAGDVGKSERSSIRSSEKEGSEIPKADVGQSRSTQNVVGKQAPSQKETLAKGNVPLILGGKKGLSDSIFGKQMPPDGESPKKSEIKQTPSLQEDLETAISEKKSLQKGTGGYLVQAESQKAGSGKKLINEAGDVGKSERSSIRSSEKEGSEIPKADVGQRRSTQNVVGKKMPSQKAAAAVMEQELSKKPNKASRKRTGTHSKVQSVKTQKSTLSKTISQTLHDARIPTESPAGSQKERMAHNPVFISRAENGLPLDAQKNATNATKVNHDGEKANSPKSHSRGAAPAAKRPVENVVQQNNPRPQELFTQKNQGTSHAGRTVQQPFPKEMFNKLIQSTRLLIQQGSSQMQIQLKPDALGAVRLLVETAQNQINVKILVNKPETQHLLEQHIQSLQHSLINQGFKIEQVQVSLQTQSDPFQQGQSFQNHQQQQGMFAQKENGEGFSESGNLFHQSNEKQQPEGHNRRFGYNSVEYVA